MTTAADLIAATRGHTDGSDRGVLARLPEALPATTADVTIAFGTRIAEHSYLSVGLETFYVISCTQQGTATCMRAMDGTDATNHDAGELVRVNPRFTDHRILEALNADLAGLSSRGLYRIRALDRTATTGTLGYDLAADLTASELIDVRWHVNSNYKEWRDITDYQVLADMDTDDFASGTALMLGSAIPDGRSVRIRYRASFGALELLTDDAVDDAGLPGTAVDIPPMGAAIRLMAGRPIQRADFNRQSEPRRAGEVPTRDVLSATAMLRQLYEERIGQERDRLTMLRGHQLVRR